MRHASGLKEELQQKNQKISKIKRVRGTLHVETEKHGKFWGLLCVTCFPSSRLYLENSQKALLIIRLRYLLNLPNLFVKSNMFQFRIIYWIQNNFRSF